MSLCLPLVYHESLFAIALSSSAFEGIREGVPKDTKRPHLIGHSNYYRKDGIQCKRG